MASFWIGFAAIAVTLISGILAQESSVEIVISDSYVKQGESFSVLCKGRLLLPSSTWALRKSFGDERATIATKSFWTEGYDIPRFSYKNVLREDDDVPNGHANFDYSLNVTDAQPGDSGVYICTVGETKQDEKRVTVTANPTEMELKISVGENEYQVEPDQGEIEVDAGEPHRLECKVSGGYPEQTVSIFAGDKDISDEFSMLAETDYTSTDMKAFPMPSSVVALKPKDPKGIVMKYSYMGQVVKCVALNREGDTTLEKQFTVKFNTAVPNFVSTCPSEALAYEYQKNVVLEANVTSLPEPSDSYFEWKPLSGGNTTKLMMGESESHYHAEVKLVEGMTYSLRLNIDQVFNQAFRDYTLVAKNEVGESSCVIKLAKAVAGSSSVILPSILLLALVQFLFHL